MNSTQAVRLPGVSGSALAGLGIVALGLVATALLAETVLEAGELAAVFFSEGLWRQLVEALGGEVGLRGDVAEIPFLHVLGVIAVVQLAGGCIAWIVHRGRARPAVIAQAWWWLWLTGVWYALWMTALLFGLSWLGAWATGTLAMWTAVSMAGWLTMLMCGGCRGRSRRPEADDPLSTSSDGLSRCIPSIAAGVFFATFAAMNWQLYENLQVPHGDSAMYEEHLWNVTHGKGFRSYLDQGLFWGEHIQFVHLALIPLHLLWPSHLLLELAESAALAIGAIAVYRIARHGGLTGRAAALLACTYLLYFPLHFLDIAIDLKTFRPISFGVPALLFAIDRWQRERFKTAAVLLLITLSAKEDYALVIAPLALWFAVHYWRAGSTRRSLWSAGTAVAVTAYLLLAVKVLIPAFRDGEGVHYARYFARFGETPTQIAWTMLTEPSLLFSELVTVGNATYVLWILVPLAGLPLLAFSRFAVGIPLVILLCLNELSQQTPAPVHHFHAPLIPILFWAAAGGLRRWSGTTGDHAVSNQRRAELAAGFATACALWTAVFVSYSPVGIAFWDPGRSTYWRTLYVIDERARQFEKVIAAIPPDARVASTDFVHPRFTHHERSYDYSGYLRAAADYRQRVPEGTDYIVIDTQHRYSTIKSPADVRELRQQPDEWELLPLDTDGYFIVLKRRDK